MNFSKAYNRGAWCSFLQNSFLPEDFELKEESVEPTAQTKYTTRVTRLGKSAQLDLAVYEVRHSSSNDARVTLSREAFRLLTDEMQGRALVLFVPEDNPEVYRFSFIEMTLEWNDTKVSKSYNNPRRFSYRLGEGIATHTPDQYLLAKGRVVDTKDLRDRFSVDVLTKEFYNELSDWYAWAIKQIRFPNDINDPNDDEKYNHEGAIRLITRLIFVWFLKQRHLIPDEFFDEHYLSEYLLKDFAPHARGDNHKEVKTIYYKAILQNLFFAMLNCPITAEGSDNVNVRRFRDGRKHFDINNLMRYEKLFKNPQLFVELANNTVPFLNGGLFDCLDNKQEGIYYDGFSDREVVNDALVFPDFLFFGDNNGETVDLSEWYGDKNKKRVPARGIIDILKRYNFTVEENTPYDKEVSLDPELLGKVFENLLAAYNPETKTTARKQTGSFYTPREIVQYMVDESLVAHLKRTVGENLETEYRKLLAYEEQEISLTDEQRHDIMLSLYNCKILDPACGSGAFPVGILQQMVHVLNQIDPNNSMWRKLMEQQATDETSEAFRATTREERDELLAEISRSFDLNINGPDYARKLYLIENCIYGVDIQPIAIQISKLRFFISLVIDQKTNNDPADNFGIRPLPNLEAKFVAANTLIGLSSSQQLTLSDTPEVLQKKKEMKDVKHRIFSARTRATKKKNKDCMVRLRQELADMLLADGFVSEGESQQLASWDMFDQNASSPFFDPDWMFGVKEGFDVVIGNPPYKVVSQNDSSKEFYNNNYKVAHGGKRNMYHLFFERGLYCTKANGILSFITPDTYFSGSETYALRKFLVANTDIKSIIHYTEKDKVFENVTQAVAVIVLCKQKHKKSFTISEANRICAIEYKTLSDSNKYVFKATDIVIQKMRLCPFNFGNICNGYKGDVNLGLKRDYFTKISTKATLPLVRGIQIAKYLYSPGEEYCFVEALGRNHTNIERIVFQEVANMGLKYRIKGTILKNVILGDSVNYIYSINDEISNKYVLGVLNSKCVNYFFKFYNQTNHVPIGELKRIPFPFVTQSHQIPIITLVDNILSTKYSDLSADTTSLENEIDFMVYKLYGLTYDEVLVVDPETPIKRDEYENAN